MAYMKRVGSINHTPPTPIEWCVNASQTVDAGSIVVVNSGKLDVAADAATAGTVAGVALDALTTSSSVDEDDYVRVDINPCSVWNMAVTGSSKTSLDREDVGKRFDLSNAYTVDLDDTTGGFLQYIGGYDSKTGRANFLLVGSYQNV